MTRTFISYLGMRVIAQKPDLSRRDRHRFRYVRTPDDLEPFVTLSDAEAVIAGANPGLKGKEREELYDRWCQWTVQDESLPWHDPANRVKSFLILDQKQPDEAWLPIGVSILLPLTIDGSRNLVGGTKSSPRTGMPRPWKAGTWPEGHRPGSSWTPGSYASVPVHPANRCNASSTTAGASDCCSDTLPSSGTPTPGQSSRSYSSQTTRKSQRC